MAIIRSLEELVRSKVDDDLRKAYETNRAGNVQGLIRKRHADNPEYAPPFGTMMAAAVYYDASDVVEFEQGGPEAVQDPVMTFVAQRGAWKSYQLLIEHNAVYINYVIPWYGDVLGNAVNGNNLTLARFCLQHGADPNRNKVDEYMSIIDAAAELGHLEMVQLLLDRGANLRGNGAIVHAGEEGQTDMVRFLLAKGADINEMGVEAPLEARSLEDIATALHHAIQNGHVGTALVLIDAGADLTRKDAKGRTPQEVAEQCEQTEVLVRIAAIFGDSNSSSFGDFCPLSRLKVITLGNYIQA